MGVSSDNGVWEQKAILIENDTSKPLEVNLMDDTVTWRNNSQVLESSLTPFKEGESFFVPDELKFFILVL